MNIYKQIDEIKIEDLEQYPVWEFLSEDDPNSIDECTIKGYKKYSTDIQAMIIVKAKFTLKDGSVFWGYVRPEEGLAYSQPAIFIKDQTITFWNGMADVSKINKEYNYKILNKKPNDVFPIYWETVEFTDMINNGIIQGFGYLDRHDGLIEKYIK